jgi:protein TonB
MKQRAFRRPEAKGEGRLGVLLGGAFALGLFVLMALAQMMGDTKPPKQELDETLVAFEAPEVLEIEEEIAPVEDEQPPPELELEPPQLSLDQLDIALNPGTGGSLAGDFALPVIQSSAQSLGTEAFVDFSNLDQIPRPIGVSGLNFPRRLKKQKVQGEIVLLVKLDETGRVIDVKIDSSNLPAFDSFVKSEIEDWRFTPPTQLGRPVKAEARLPIPIRIS